MESVGCAMAKVPPKYFVDGDPNDVITESEIELTVELAIAGGLIETDPKSIEECIEALEELGYEIGSTAEC